MQFGNLFDAQRGSRVVHAVYLRSLFGFVLLQEATTALQEEQRRKALDEEQKLAQERGPILGVHHPLYREGFLWT